MCVCAHVQVQQGPEEDIGAGVIGSREASEMVLGTSLRSSVRVGTISPTLQKLVSALSLK